MMLIERLQSRVQERKRLGLYRDIPCVKQGLSTDPRVFCSNDYLGLSTHASLPSICQEQSRLGYGSGASAHVSGYTACHRDAETAWADHMGFEAGLLLSTGYMANVGLIQALIDRGDFILQDRLNHASLIDGARLSVGHLKRYHHQDMGHLEQLLERTKGHPQLVVTDAVFSMRGDQAPLEALSDLRKKYGFTLMVDDAHGLGVVGPHGLGSVAQAGLTADNVDCLICPFGKAVGAFGAMILGTHDTIDGLRQFMRSYVYTTAMPPMMAALLQHNLHLMQTETWRHARLQELIAYFKTHCDQTGYQWWESQTAIQSLVLGSSEEVMRVQSHLAKHGFWVGAIRSPTVPSGEEQIRFTITVNQTEASIDRLFHLLSEVMCAV